MNEMDKLIEEQIRKLSPNLQRAINDGKRLYKKLAR